MHDKFTLWYIKLTAYMWKKKFTLIHGIFDPVFPGDLTKIRTDQNILQVFLHCLERKN